MNPIPIDPQQIIVSALLIMPIIFGLVEFIKGVFNLSGTAATATSFIVGFCLEGIYLAGSLLPSPYNVIISGFFACLTIGLATSGYYKYASQRIMKVKDLLEMTKDVK